MMPIIDRISNAQGDYCDHQGLDPQDPPCGHVCLTGRFNIIIIIIFFSIFNAAVIIFIIVIKKSTTLPKRRNQMLSSTNQCWKSILCTHPKSLLPSYKITITLVIVMIVTIVIRVERVLDPEEQEFARRALFSRHPNME